MRREPLRPLAQVIHTREQGENPDMIEARARAKRNQAIAVKHRLRAENRLLILGLAFVVGFGAIGAKMGMLANSAPAETAYFASTSKIINQRADITDRNGNVLATNLTTQALYAQPPLMVDGVKAAKDLVEIFPDLDLDRLTRDFTSGKRKFIWLKKRISPEQRQLVHDLGEPGLLFGNREMRLYPNGKLAAHILGGTRFGEEGVRAAEVLGVAGVEKYFDDMLRDPALEGSPLQLSLDLSAQSATREVLEDGMIYMNAKGAAAILMDVHTGEILSMVSLPDFDPNERPRPATTGDASDSPLFNRAAQGVYELGSTFKIFTVATSLEKGLANPNTMIETKSPMKWGKFPIRDYKNYGPELSVQDVIMKSSNVGTARMALAAGTSAQKDMLKSLGFFEEVPVELIEASQTKPLLPKRWSDISTITISYGHGLSATPLHLATAYASMANGGYAVKPTLQRLDVTEAKGARVMSERTSQQLVNMLRRVVNDENGTATMGEVPGYEVAGKTGTAEKPNAQGGYDKKKVIATFASVFPASNPKYTLVVALDEPEINAVGEDRRTAGWTAVPVAAEIIARVAPILGLRPLAPKQPITYTQTSNQ
ncbi:cell division protein FtsI [Amylibacter marinus]|uniref:Cell division protein FtsI n=1 Tax=Amylibacter marinus TaxID=1475483 RepID=A0ABQ5VUH4_9RHOB|nr:penicillin-binding protein 2 [Amylibacter marinus]GLQ34878.1 cell division protein FtsI [Amylibacter marinus]